MSTGQRIREWYNREPVDLDVLDGVGGASRRVPAAELVVGDVLTAPGFGPDAAVTRVNLEGGRVFLAARVVDDAARAGEPWAENADDEWDTDAAELVTVVPSVDAERVAASRMTPTMPGVHSVAVGRFEQGGPRGYRAATMPEAPTRSTRDEAEHDESIWRQRVEQRDQLACVDCGHKRVSHGSYASSGFVGIGNGECGIDGCACLRFTETMPAPLLRTGDRVWLDGVDSAGFSAPAEWVEAFQVRHEPEGVYAGIRDASGGGHWFWPADATLKVRRGSR